MHYKKINFEEKLPFTFHLAEIRHRLIRIIIFVSVLFIICFSLSERLLSIIRAPIKNYDLIFITATEAFFVHLKLGFFAALALSVPFILYHIWEFISPGLKVKEKKYTLPFVIFSSIFFALGVLFGYFIILPLGLPFLLSYKTSSLMPALTVGNYTSFILKLLLVFGAIFELPLIAILLTKIGILKPALLIKNRMYAILIIFIVSAILTPPDVVTQVLMAMPLIALYEISVILCRIVYREGGKNKEKAEES